MDVTFRGPIFAGFFVKKRAIFFLPRLKIAPMGEIELHFQPGFSAFMLRRETVMSLILVIDDTPFWRETASCSLRVKDHEILSASDGLEGLALLAGHRVDLVILDIEMPKLDGIGFLKKIRRQEQWKKIPVIVLTGNTQRENIVRAKMLGAAEYLLKSKFSPEVLVERVQRWLAVDSNLPDSSSADPGDVVPGADNSMSISLSSISPILTAEQCIERATRVLAGRALSGTVAQVISVASSPRTDTQQLTSLISRDPMLSARVLHAANSAAYTSSRGVVTTIHDAIRNIGCTTVRNVAAALGIFDTIPSTPGDGFNPIRHWQHSFAVAQLCERLCAASKPDDAGIAYLVGLCHDLGEILFQTQFATEYHQILKLTAQTGRSYDEVERHLIGMSQSELVLALLRQIGLPDAIREPIEATYKAKGGDMPKHPLAQILTVANFYANGALLASSNSSLVAPLTQAVCKAAINNPNPSCPDLEAMRSEVFALTSVLGPISSKEASELMTPLYPRSNATIRIVREAAFSSYDPIAAALGAVAKIEVDTTLSRSLAGDAEGLVVIARSPCSSGFSAMEISEACQQSGRRDFPVFWLTGKDPAGEAPLPAASIVRHFFPIELAALMEFVAAVEKKQLSKAA
ncbi:MAG TPA: HDOD domain-containing protein [Tepidisphaeraceae bacterium]|jgi:HD-like signal output (HDOD) protein/CheY-like chemotaxis protein|nr:HDOD domain-containing protein [Tepidisphaeraceae bacterium]